MTADQKVDLRNITSERILFSYHTGAGKVDVRPVRVACFPTTLAFFLLQDVARKHLNPDYLAQTSIAQRLNSESLKDAWDHYQGCMLYSLMVMPPTPRLGLLGDLIRFIEWQQDATGIEALYASALLSSWNDCDVEVAGRALSLWTRIVRVGQYAAQHTSVC